VQHLGAGAVREADVLEAHVPSIAGSSALRSHRHLRLLVEHSVILSSAAVAERRVVELRQHLHRSKKFCT